MLEMARIPTWLPSSFPSCRHLKEISELQSQQKQEIEALYRRLGKPLPPNLGLFHTAPPIGRRRKTSKSKLKAGKLLSPLVQQLKVVASSTGWPKGPPSHPQTWELGRWEAGTRPWKSASCISFHWSKEASSGPREPRPPPLLLSSVLLPAECCPGWGLLPLIPFLRCMSAPDSGG